jgi:hypothetical protein
MSALTLLEVSSVICFATAFRTAFGFGEALIAVPLLSLLLPVKVAAPVAVLSSILIALVAVLRERAHIHVSSAGRLLIATAFGLPFGLMLLRLAPENLTKGCLGVLLLSFSLFSFLKPGVFTLKNDRLIWVFGFLAGITGGSYGMNGPPLAIFGAARGWSPQRFRATIQAYFLPASLLGMVGYYFSGLWTKEVNILFVYSLPAILLGIFLGAALARRMDQTRFARLLYVGLIFVSLLLIAQPIAR